MTAYYNEIDPYAAQWLRNLISAGLIAPGDVDERSIVEVQPDDLRGYTQCHFFAGIGGWSVALRLAGWGDARPVWTGSCPCQPFSSATHGRGRGLQCEKHLWPELRRLIAKIRPNFIFGEQVDEAGAWLDGLCDDMEKESYTVRACVLPAYCVGKDHARERIYFACNTNVYSQPSRPIHAETSGVSWRRGDTREMVREDGVPPRVAYRGFGNAIVPQVAAEFIKAYMECA